LAALNGQEGFGHGNGDLAWFEAAYSAIAPNNMKAVPLSGCRVISCGRGLTMRRVFGLGCGGLWCLHEYSCARLACGRQRVDSKFSEGGLQLAGEHEFA